MTDMDFHRVNFRIVVAIAAGLAFYSGYASADDIEAIRADRVFCETVAAETTSGTGYQSATAAGVRTLAGVVGAWIAGRDGSSELSYGAQSGINGAASDVQMAEMRRQQVVDQCMMQRRSDRARNTR